MTTVKTGIIGCGGIARRHAAAYVNLPQAQFVAVCDALPERAQQFAEQYGAKPYSDPATMLRESGVQAVSICTPHLLHPPLLVLAAEHGVHAITEKPMGITLDECDRAIAAAQKAGTKQAVIFQRRFWPASLRLRAAIDAGKLGTPVLGSCTVRFSRPPAYYARDAWRGKWASEGGGVLVNQAVHAIDMFQWYMGPIASLSGRWSNLTHPYIEVEDTAVASLKFQNGALGSIETSVSPDKTDYSFARVVIYGSNGGWASVTEQPEGRVGLNDVWEIPGEVQEGRERYREETARDEFMFESASGGRPVTSYHQLQLEDFLDAIVQDRQPLVTGEEGRKSVEIIQAIYRSGQAGQDLPFPLADRTSAIAL
ncbi:MAG TPA: Gfo/Idh/MocA family oxidoreductase [Chloroflexota bacterium]